MANQSSVDKIRDRLSSDDVMMVLLIGKPGIGKTWIAKKVSDLVKRDGLFQLSFWLSLCRKLDGRALFESLAGQLSIMPTEEWDDDDDDVDDEDEEKMQAEDYLGQKISVAIREKRCLLILDDVSKDTNIEEIISDFSSVIPDFKRSSFKFLVTSRDRDVIDNLKIALDVSMEVISIEPFSLEDSKAVLQLGIKFPDFVLLFESIAEKSSGIPAAIVAMIEALNYIGEHKYGALQDLVELAANNISSIIACFLRTAHEILPSDDLIHCFRYSWCYFHLNGPVNFAQLIAHWIMDSCLGHVDCVKEAFDKGYTILMELLHRGLLKHVEASRVVTIGSVMRSSYCWIRGEEDFIIHCWNRYESYSVSGSKRLLLPRECCLEMAPALNDFMWEGFGDIAQIDGVIRTVGYRESAKISTLLLDGNRFSKEFSDAFFTRLKDLHILGIFSPMLKYLPASFSQMKKLTVLVFRGCEFLENIDHIRELKSLVVLEISGATSLTTITDDLFEQMLQLQSLNLSEAQFSELPKSISNLTELRWFILRGCCRLKILPRVGALNKLEVLDLCGASSLKNILDKSFSMLKKLTVLDLSHSQILRLPDLSNMGELTQLLLRNCRRLYRHPELDVHYNLHLDLSGAMPLKEIPFQIHHTRSLKVLDLSESSVQNLPALPGDLSHIILRNCYLIKQMPSTVDCKDLVFLDISGCSDLVNIKDESFSHLRWLRHLNLSKTSIRSLPSLSNLVNLRHLLLRDCILLETLPTMEGLKRLEVLDLTNAISLRDFSVEYFPYISLRQLLLPGCSSLRMFEILNLENLEVLDLSGCTDLLLNYYLNKFCSFRVLSLSGIQCLLFPNLQNLSNIEELYLSYLKNPQDIQYSIKHESFEHLTNLRILDLSHTPLLNGLPAISTLTNLTHLLLRGWSDLLEVPHLEALTRLEVLDLSGTGVERLPSLKTLGNLSQLLLRGCRNLSCLQHLESLSHLEALDLWGTRINEFPYDISELTSLKHLDLPFHEVYEELDWRRIKRLPEEVNWIECGIFKAEKIFTASGNNHHILVSGIKFFQVLDENPMLWDKFFKQFHFSVFPPMKEGQDGAFFRHRDEPKFRDIYTRTRCFPNYLETHSKTLEIHSLSLFTGLERVLRQAEYVYLCDNTGISCLSELGVNNIRAMNGCFLETCTSMETVFAGEEEAIGLPNNLEALWVSNLVNLKNICSRNVQPESFRNLRHLYIDCCPLLHTVFSSAQ